MKCSLNKRIRYTIETMPDGIAMIYDRLIDKNFIEKYLQFLIFEEPKFNQTRFDLFKVNNWTIEMVYLKLFLNYDYFL